ncbi:MAG: FGGY-family carbohydrate kinase [Flavisolibacter sp.]
MLLLGLDVGTSSIKVSVVDAETRKCIASTYYPEMEAPITSLNPGWAEQSPGQWWADTLSAIKKLHQKNLYNPAQIGAIGISYQMHGLVLIDKNQNVLRDSIIWCDSRAIEIGKDAFKNIGSDYCLNSLLNSPGNFTASKLEWVKKNEPEIFKKVAKIMLPGDFIAMKLTGDCTTTSSALSEGILWDYAKEDLSATLMDYYGFDKELIPEMRSVFSVHGGVREDIAQQLSLKKGIPVTYKAGDQLNNAMSLNVLQPGQVAATAGTSGVVYGVTDQLFQDPKSRVNTFVHVNHKKGEKRLGVLLCVNGTGIMNRWIREICAGKLSYQQINHKAATITPGSQGLRVLPFGNGAERMLGNRITGATLWGIDLNIHTQAHIFRAVQEGICFAFRYGLDILKENGLKANQVRAPQANLFLSDVFVESFVQSSGVGVELYDTDGSQGAAIGAGIGAGIYFSPEDAFKEIRPVKRMEPGPENFYEEIYQDWKVGLLKNINE